MTKTHSQACDNNKQPILDKLLPLLRNRHAVLEIGSGTGQHAVHFAAAMPHLTWQTSDLAVNHYGIRQWISESGLTNVKPPLSLDLNQPWPVTNIDALYTANTLHIVSKSLVKVLFNQIKQNLADQGLVIIYGPFNYAGKFTSDSNASFDAWLKERDSQSGIRDIEWIIELAKEANLQLLNDDEMPANNRLLSFIKTL
ncbi:MAG: DUF938 domain-containing protein [Psychrobium sp.]